MVSIAFTGDISFSKYFCNRYTAPDLVDGKVVEFLNSANYAVLNVESALTDRLTQVLGSDPAHASNPACVKWLQHLNGKIWNLGNNHTLDAGKEGLVDTIALANAYDVKTLGAGETIKDAKKPILLQGCGGIGLISVCYKKKYMADEQKPGCVFWQDFERIERMIKQVKSTCQWCVLIAHGGEEFASLPLPNTRGTYRKYLALGADIVVGHHPHVPQPYEKVGDKTIFYSLGNFIFDTDYQRLQAHTQEGIILKLNFHEKTYSWECMPIHIDRTANRVVQGQMPTNFFALTEESYQCLIPITTKRYFEKIKRARVYLSPKAASFTKEEWDSWFERNRGKEVYQVWVEQLKRYKKEGCDYPDKQLIEYINANV